MAIKKSELYGSLWESCNELRGSMDASLYKDYILVLLFIKYISDKYADEPFAPIVIPEGASFKDMLKLKGNPEIGDKINKEIIGRIVEANGLKGTIDIADFNKDEMLGSGQEKTDKLSKLVAVFENPALDFSKNKAEGDDILGDAYEFLMRKFATESGKSKGQFYTPAEVSRILAKLLGINHANVTAETTVYDPTCGSGSLLLKVGDEAHVNISLYGQEMDMATAALARMNMVLHNHASDVLSIKHGNTIANPLFIDNNHLRTFDYVVANPPFSNKNWTSGIEPDKDTRFTDFGTPPEKNGDYAFLLHIVKSLKSNGKAAVILPHGVLFRGNAEAEIRKKLLQKGYIKAIIGLPANLFYGTGIPACIIVIDKNVRRNARTDRDTRTGRDLSLRDASVNRDTPVYHNSVQTGRDLSTHDDGIFFIDAAKGFLKDGDKNRLREQDIHKIVSTYNAQLEVPKFSRFVPMNEIADAKNDYNLNIPRYIDAQEEEDAQDIGAHLYGGIPAKDVADLSAFWQVFPSLEKELFAPFQGNKERLQLKTEDIKTTIFQHSEFLAFDAKMKTVFETWKSQNADYLFLIEKDVKPKAVISHISEDILAKYSEISLMDKYDIYQYVMNYWSETMQDDLYIIAADGWKADIIRITETNKKTGKITDKGWTCDLVPPDLITNRYFATEAKQIVLFEAKKENLATQLEELAEEHGAEDGFFAEWEKIDAKTIDKRLKTLEKSKKPSETEAAEIKVLTLYLENTKKQITLTAQIKTAKSALNDAVFAKYSTLQKPDIQQLVIHDKWMASIEKAVKSEMERISQRLTQRVTALADRYATPLSVLNEEVSALELTVMAHLKTMGF